MHSLPVQDQRLPLLQGRSAPVGRTADPLFPPLGFLELDLHRTIIPAKSSEKCHLDMIPDLNAMDPLKVKTASLFEQKSMRGWWPCYRDQEGSRVLAVGAFPGGVVGALFLPFIV